MSRTQFHLHLVEVWGYRVDVYQPCNVFVVRKVSQKGDLPQCPFRQLYLLKHSSDELDCHRLSRYLVSS